MLACSFISNMQRWASSPRVFPTLSPPPTPSMLIVKLSAVHVLDGRQDESQYRTITVIFESEGRVVTKTAIVPDGPPSTSTQTGCPTVTETRSVCPSCRVPGCLTIATATQSCDCPEKAETVTVEFPCESGCSGMACWTSWAFETQICEPPGDTPKGTEGFPTSA